MSDKKSMTLTLGDAELKALEELCAKKDATKTAIIRQAIRLYHLMDAKLSDGARLVVQEADTKSELLVL